MNNARGLFSGINKQFLIEMFFPLIATLLFFYFYYYEAFWLDHHWHIYIASSANLETFARLWAEQPHPPLYFIVLWFTKLVFGDSALAMRLPSCVAHIISCGIVLKILALFFKPLPRILLTLGYLGHPAVVLGFLSRICGSPTARVDFQVCDTA